MGNKWGYIKHSVLMPLARHLVYFYGWCDMMILPTKEHVNVNVNVNVKVERIGILPTLYK